MFCGDVVLRPGRSPRHCLSFSSPWHHDAVSAITRPLTPRWVRVVTAVIAATPLLYASLIGMMVNWPIQSTEPDFGGSVAGIWFFGILAVLAAVGGICVAINKVVVGAGFLIASAAVLVAGFVL